MGKTVDRGQVADRLHSAAIHLLRRVQRVDAETGLSPARLSALSVVVFAGPLSIGRLADAQMVRPPTMTRIVQGLEDAGLVRRKRSGSDARRVLVAATARGNRLLRRGRARRLEVLTEVLAPLPDRDVALLARAVGILEALIPGGAAAARRATSADR